jgi:hypothetical protein
VVANTLPHPVSQKGAHIAVHGAPGRKGRRGWQMPPLTAGAHEIEQTIQQLSHVRGPRPPTGPGGRNERLQQAELVIRQCLAGAKVANQRAIGRCPHGGLQTGNHLHAARWARINPLNQPHYPFANGLYDSVDRQSTRKRPK